MTVDDFNTFKSNVQSDNKETRGEQRDKNSEAFIYQKECETCLSVVQFYIYNNALN